MLDGYRLIGGDQWKPDVETRPNPGSAGHRNCPVVFLNDFTNRREPEAVAVGTRRKERLENPLQRPFVDAAPRISDRYDRVPTRPDVNNPDRQHFRYLPSFN